MDFSEIYRRYAKDVHRYSLYLSGNYALAEDLTAETFVHALCRGADLKVDTVKAYLLAIARNLYRDTMDRERRLSAMGDAQERMHPEPSPERTVEGRQALSAVLAAIQRLPESQRDALVLAVDEDMRHDQIAAILGCSVVAVKVRIHRARLQIRAELEQQEKAWKT